MYDSLQSQNRIRAIDPSAAIRIMIRQQAAVKNITLHQQAQDFSQAPAILQSGSHSPDRSSQILSSSSRIMRNTSDAAAMSMAALAVIVLE